MSDHDHSTQDIAETLVKALDDPYAAEVVDLTAFSMATASHNRRTVRGMLTKMQAEDRFHAGEPVFDETCDATGFVPDYDRSRVRA
jgi:hypothetical protein